MNATQRILNILIALDQLLYVLLTFGRGSPDETLSAAAWRVEKAGKPWGRIFRPVIDFIFLPMERNHCYRSYISEQRGAQLPKEYRL